MSNSESEPADPPQALRSSPFSGCFILVSILVIFGGLIVLYTVVGIYQNRTIDEFTQAQPAEITLLTPGSAQLETANAKLGQISQAVANEASERIEFTAEDLNVLIASMEELKDFRNQTYVERISPQGIVAKMAQPMRRGVFNKTPRYLNATFVFQPEVRARTVAFKVVDIRADVGEVPEGFKENYATLDFFRLDPELEAMKTHIRSIAAVYAEPGKLIVETKIPDVEPVE
jgi:hypothetical protein